MNSFFSFRNTHIEHNMKNFILIDDFRFVFIFKLILYKLNTAQSISEIPKIHYYVHEL